MKMTERISHYIPKNLLTALETFKIMARETKTVHTSSTRSDIINDAVNRYLVEATHKFIQVYGENEFTQKIMNLLKNPFHDDLFLWSVIKK